MQPITDKAVLFVHEAQISCQRATNWCRSVPTLSVGTWLLSGWLCVRSVPAAFVACSLPGLMAWNRLRVGKHRAALHSTKQRALQVGDELESRMSDLNKFIALFKDTIQVRPTTTIEATATRKSIFHAR